MGKTHYISVLGRALEENLKCSSSSVVVPVHGPIVTVSSIIDGLRQIKDYHKPMLFHLDIAPSVSLLTGIFVFSKRITQCFAGFMANGLYFVQFVGSSDTV